MFMAVSDFNLQLAGSDTVTQWFGAWPDFHDAEVISLNLSRKAQSILRVYPYYPEKPATVEFVLNEITDLDLADFSSQNVVSGLSIEQVINKEGGAVLRLQMFPCYGLAGYIDAKQVQLNLIPGWSTDGGSAW
jgi:Immunity protein 50